MACWGRMSSGWALGLFFLFLVAVIWAGASVLTQFIYENLDYEQPFILTYIGNSLFAIYLPSWAAMAGLGWVANPPWRREKRVTIADMSGERSESGTPVKNPTPASHNWLRSVSGSIMRFC